MIEEIILILELVVVSLLLTFLWVFYAFYRSIRPLVDRFTTRGGGLKIPSIKEAIGYGIMKAVDTVDFSRMLGMGKRE